ncbi:MAG TPA: M28 family peptidase [Thermoanaerobaculia bacterium]|nr:M28 family peptidase [Thermoanaerobaculia bacterium]
MRTDVRRLILVGVAAVAAFTAQSPAPKKAPPAAAARPMPAIAAEVLSPRSRLESDLRFLTDEIGGRTTGSDAYEQALAWGLAAFKRAGVDGGGLETYDAPSRWEGGRATGAVVSPFSFPLRIISFAMAPSTGGEMTAPLVDAGEGRAADFGRLGEKARAAIALVRSKPMQSFEDLFAEYLAGPEMVRAAAESGVAAVLFVSTRPRGLLYRHTITFDGKVVPIPMAQVAREDGLRLARLLEKGRDLRVSLDIQNRVGGAWKPQNVVADIRGSERPDEIVLLGAHLDSWDLGTGALDNGVNCALVIEVARAIAAGPRPKRTVRFVLFTGEETGLLGSRGYVTTHKAEMDKHVAALIHDIGDGKVLGYFTNGRPEVRPGLGRALAPVAGWGSAGMNDEAILGTDNFDFLLEGVPNLIANQETAKYLPDYHAESDTLDKVDIEQARRNAAVAAVAVLGLANAPARLAPRQSRAEVEKLLEKSGLARQMKTYGLWEDWETGKRGRN